MDAHLHKYNSSTYVYEILSPGMMDRRSEGCPKFLDISRLAIRRQSFANCLGIIARKIKFNWNGVTLSDDEIRVELKISFFTCYPVRP